ncbi:MAG: hypothetical protein M1840_007598 [Geoglossum simile]|nr:MAG: hypothetical protein M1840_007598 [Geoglossum simile]
MAASRKTELNALSILADVASRVTPIAIPGPRGQPESQKEQLTKGTIDTQDEDLKCFSEDCTSKSPLRRVVARTFGGEKKYIRQSIAQKYWIHYCMCHYLKYMGKNEQQFVSFQQKLVKAQVDALHGSGVKWIITVSKAKGSLLSKIAGRDPLPMGKKALKLSKQYYYLEPTKNEVHDFLGWISQLMSDENLRETNFRTNSSRGATFKDVKILPCNEDTKMKWWIGERKKLEDKERKRVDNMLEEIRQKDKQEIIATGADGGEMEAGSSGYADIQ